MYELPLLHPDEVIEYHRKSRSDDPNLTVEEVLAKHKAIADRWVSENLPGPIPEKNIYMERIVSGETIADRPVVQEVLRRVESPSIKAILVIEPQRLSRGDLEDAGHIINVLRYSKTLVLTPRRHFDLSDDGDRMLFEMELKQGNQYLEYIKTIMARGKENAVRNGKSLSAVIPFGYDRHKGVLVPNKDAEIVRRIFGMFVDGNSFKEIADWMEDMGYKRPGRTSLFNMVHNPVYIGKIQYRNHTTQKQIEKGRVVKKRVKDPDKKILTEGQHEPLISMDLWNKAQSRNLEASRKNSAKKMVNPFAGILRCGGCGYVIPLHTKTGSPYYYCKHCRPSRTVPYADVYDEILFAINAELGELRASDDGGTDKAHLEWEEKVRTAETRVEELKKKELKIWEDRYGQNAMGMPEEIFRRISLETQKARESAQNALRELLDAEPKEVDTKAIEVTLSEVLELLKEKDVPAERQNRLFKLILKEAYVQKDEEGILNFDIVFA